MKLTLIRPPEYFGTGHPCEFSPPYGLYSLKTYVKDKYRSLDIQILDLTNKRYRGIQLEKVLADNDSDVFGLTGLTGSRFEVVKIARCIKERCSKSYVIVGGPHFTYCAKETLERVADIDIVVCGEGELTIVELLDSISKKEGFEKIKGITYRNGSQIVENESRPAIEDLDAIPLYTDFDKYEEFLRCYPGRMRAISIISSRGCPANCVFCAKPMKGYRLRNPKKVIDEIELYKGKYNIGGFNFLDLTFTADAGHVKKICDEIIARKLNIKWWCESRANISLDLLDLMKRAGCVSMSVGVESGSPRILSEIHKGITVEQVLGIAKKCSDIGIFIEFYFMYSLPGETEGDVRKTLDLIDKVEKYPFSLRSAFQPAMIFPGAKLETIARENGILPKNFSWYDNKEYELNKALNQIPNIPLYVDSLSPDTLKKLYSERVFRLAASVTNKKNFIIFLKWISNNPSALKRILRYVFSPAFWYKFIKAKMKSSANIKQPQKRY